MKNMELSIHEIKSLIKKYESELRQINFQATRVKQILLELKTSLRNEGTHKTMSISSNHLPTEMVHDDPIAHPKLSSRIPMPAFGYRMSPWDQFILNCLYQKEEIIESSGFHEMVINEQFHTGELLDDEQIKGKISRSLHKLVNKKELLVKINTPGKGYGYALNTWLDDNGNLLEKYLPR